MSDKKRDGARPLPLIGPVSYYLHHPEGRRLGSPLYRELRELSQVAHAYSRGEVKRFGVFYDRFPKDSQAFLIAARLTYFVSVATADVALFDLLRTDLDAYPTVYDSPYAELGCRLMKSWIAHSLGAGRDRPDYMSDFPMSEFPTEWRYAVALLVMKMLHRGGEHLAAWSVADLLMHPAHTAKPDTMAEIHIKLIRTQICQDMGRMEMAERWARETVECARKAGVIAPFFGQLLGPKSPLERNLKELAPEMHAAVYPRSNAYFRGILKLHNHLTGDTCAENLTAREFYVAQSLVRGLTYKEVALRLGVAYSRVNEIVTALHEKLGVRTTAEMKPLVW